MALYHNCAQWYSLSMHHRKLCDMYLLCSIVFYSPQITPRADCVKSNTVCCKIMTDIGLLYVMACFTHHVFITKDNCTIVFMTFSLVNGCSKLWNNMTFITWKSARARPVGFVSDGLSTNWYYWKSRNAHQGLFRSSVLHYTNALLFSISYVDNWLRVITNIA